MTDEKKDKDPNRMEYRMLGGTGLKVSVLSFGFWATYGAKGDLKNEAGVKRAIEVMQACRDGGINMFDNAEVYGDPQGAAETCMGKALAWLRSDENPKKDMWRRSEIVVTTKIFWAGPGKNEKGTSRKHLMEGMDAALKRLQMDCVDLVFAHRNDPLTPVEETVRGFTQLIRDGKAYYWGTSEWTAQQITEAYWVAKTYNLIAPAMDQCQYSMLVRDKMEKEFVPLFRAPYNYGSTIWSPLKSGILTGKYNKEIPEGSRARAKGYEWLGDLWRKNKDEWLPKVEKLMALAKELDCTVAQLAIAWCAKNPNVSTVLLGATKISQIQENIKALAVARRLDEATMAKIEEILQNAPEKPENYGRSLEKSF